MSTSKKGSGLENSLQPVIISNDTLNVNDQSGWIEETFKKRECVKFIQDDKNTSKCMCGRLRSSHPNTNEGILRTTYPVSEKWNFSTHTELSATDAYGTIEFQGGPHPTKAQYVRLSFDTKPEKIVQLLHHHWGLDIPKLLISVHGGIANFDLQPKLRRVCKQGLFSAAKTTGAWVTTGGTNTGVMKHVGEALGDTLVQSRNNIITIGIAPWGVVHKREDLIGKDITVPYLAISLPGSDNIVLNSSHSYFLLVDDGSVGRFGCETALRKNLEKYISQQRVANNRGYKDYGTPVVCLLMEGGSNCIRTVLECVTDHPPIPVVVIDGSGRASDLLTMPEVLKEQLLATISRTFMYGPVACERVFTELMLCTKQKSLITIFRIGEEAQDIDQAILTALLKSQNASSLYQLNLTMAWNREGALDNAMMEALVADRVDFVRLLIENGVNMTRWLTIKRLEDLYNQVLYAPRPTQVKHTKKSSFNARAKLDSTSTLRFLLTEHKRSMPANYRFTLYDIGQVINKLMGGGFQAIYGRRKYRLLHNAAKNKQSFRSSVASGTTAAAGAATTATLPATSDEYELLLSSGFKYPYSELMIWAVLLRRQKMAMFMWERGEESLAKCLVAAKLYKGMIKESEEDEYEIDVANEIRRYHSQFFDMATELLDHCYKTNEELSQLLLTYELSNWSNETCLSLAVAGSNKSFIAHTCCQLLLTQMWMGGLRTRKYPSLKVIFGILCFPSILFFSYRSREELEMMPQTQDVHEHYSDVDSTDSDSDLTDTENAAILQTLQQQQQQLQHLQIPNVIVDVPDTPVKIAPSSAVAVTTAAAGGQATSAVNSVAVSTTASVNSTDAAIGKNASPSVSVLQHQRSQRTRFGQLSRSRSKRHHRSRSNLNDMPFQKEVIAPIIDSGKRSQLHITSKIVEFYTAPITKFWLHAIGYCIFLLIFIYMVLQSTPVFFPSYIEWYIFAYMCGLTLEKIREFITSEATKIKQKIHIFFYDLWNLLDMMSICLFFTGFVIRFSPSLISSARAFFCLTVSVCIIRVVDFFVISPRLGPVVHTTGKMLKEFLSLLSLILVSMVAFGTFRQSLWFPDNDFEWESVREIFLKPYFMLYGEVYHEIVWPDCVDNVTSPDDFKCVSGRWLVPVALSIYLAVGIIVLLSLVIAVFNGIFMKAYLQSNIVWKFQRYVLVIEYEARPILPSPFIIISHIIMAIRFVVQRCINKRKRFDQGLKVFLHEEDLEKLHDFEEECMELYHREKSQLASNTNDYFIKQTVDKLEKASNRLDDIQQKENSISQCLLMMELHLSRIEEVALATSTSLWSLQQQFLMVQQQQQQPADLKQEVQHEPQQRDSIISTRMSTPISPFDLQNLTGPKQIQTTIPQIKISTANETNDPKLTRTISASQTSPSKAATDQPQTATPTSSSSSNFRLRRSTKGGTTTASSVGKNVGNRSSTASAGGRVDATGNNNNNYNNNIVMPTSSRRNRSYSDYVESLSDDRLESLSRIPTLYRNAEQKYSSFYPVNRFVELHPSDRPPQSQQPSSSSKLDAKLRFLQQQQQQPLSPQLVHLLPYAQQQQQHPLQQLQEEPHPTYPVASSSFHQALPSYSFMKPPFSHYPTDCASWKKYAHFPLTPIVTPMRVEYTSITDDIDTSSFLLNDSSQSPPDTPPPYSIPQTKLSSTSTGPSAATPSFIWPGGRIKSGNVVGASKRGKKKKIRSTPPGRRFSSGSTVKSGRETDRLKEAEENVNEQLKTVVKRRMRQMSLTEPDNEYANLAKYALETIEFPEEEEEIDFDDEDECEDEFDPDCDACRLRWKARGRDTEDNKSVENSLLKTSKIPLCKSNDDIRNTTESRAGPTVSAVKLRHNHHHHHDPHHHLRRRHQKYNEDGSTVEVIAGGHRSSGRGGKLKSVRSEPSMALPDLGSAIRGVSNNLITLKEGTKEEEEEEEKLMLKLKKKSCADSTATTVVVESADEDEDRGEKVNDVCDHSLTNTRFIIGGGCSGDTAYKDSISSNPTEFIDSSPSRLLIEDEFNGIEMVMLSHCSSDQQPQQHQSSPKEQSQQQQQQQHRRRLSFGPAQQQQTQQPQNRLSFSFVQQHQQQQQQLQQQHQEEEMRLLANANSPIITDTIIFDPIVDDHSTA
ncbi:hypothetical protein HELRODRAFT_169845 [Helobdella robusta]|uniref:TRPM SLOG domain-containing protein n=1 Tax=Helobdella robusta TaxID=6412 RepID=T1F2D4_HELRO|nr:hypothetical protein HELRODRAFT_169845 [Helobdella robusta]ESO08111.1 hypothetical protein HELRODRAFT_169845 [Helobdella robusta]